MEDNNSQQVIKPGDAPSQTPPPQDPVPRQTPENKPPEVKKSRKKFSRKKLLAGAGFILFVLLLVFAIPASRYTVLGLFIKKNVSIVVEDADTAGSVSGAKVALGDKTKQTDAAGRADFKNMPAGNYDLKISKRYYKNHQSEVTVPAFGDGNFEKIGLEATGRPVQISVINKISGKGLGGAVIKAADTEAETDKDGSATIVLPAEEAKLEATIQRGGYNGLVADIVINNPNPNDNQFAMIPSGKVYFMSRLRGTIDIVKTDLDGSDRQVVLAGTGNEQEDDTVLLISRDWRYLALKARREAGKPKLYLIDTEAEEKLTIMDQTDAEFRPVGWSGHNFVYRAEKNVAPWQKGRHSLRYYNAKDGKSVKVDESAAGGTDNYFSYFETIENIFALSGGIVYSKSWSTSNPSSITDETTRIMLAGFEGGKPKALREFAAPKVSFISAVHHKPEMIYFAANLTNGNTNYFEYKNKELKPSGIDASTFRRSYPTYLISPSGEKTFWTENRDGQSVMFIGDSQAGNETDIATLPGYSAFGWYTNDYILASKSGHELYIMAPEKDLDPLKIANFHKPPFVSAGQSYSYGSL